MGSLDDAKKLDEAKDTIRDFEGRDVLASGTPAPDDPGTDPSHPTGPTGPSDPTEPTEPSEPTAPTGPMGFGGSEGDPSPVPTDPSPIPPEPGADPHEDLSRRVQGVLL